MKRMRFTVLAIATCLSAGAAFAEQPELYSNRVKYADTGVANGTGKSGSAAVQTRALFGKNGATDVELTTGALDGAAGAGSIDSVHLRTSSGAVDNFNNLSGATTIVRTAKLHRGDTVTMQANVSGIDGARTDVVDVSEVVKYRPDLSVDYVSLPARAMVGLPALIHATVREKNGDTGARANCRLLADGVEVDRAEGIWVDAKDAVDCSFAPIFADGGVKHLQVIVDHVAPADWDDANNTAVATLEIFNTMGTWTARAWEDTVEQTGMTDAWYGPNFEMRDEGRNVATHDETRFDAAIATTVNLETTSLDYSETTDGQQLISLHPTSFGGGGDWPHANCGVAGGRYATLIVCSDNGLTEVSARNGYATIDYLSHYTLHFLYDDGTTRDASFTIHMRQTAGGGARFGSRVGMHVTLRDGDRVWAADPDIALTPFDDPPTSESHYSESNGDRFYWESTYHHYGKSGEVSNAY